MKQLKKIVKEFKDEYLRENHSYSKMDRLRLKLDDYAEEKKRSGGFTQEQVNVIKYVGWFYHNADIEYDYYNRKRFLMLLDSVLEDKI